MACIRNIFFKETELDCIVSQNSNYIVIDQGTSSTKAFLFNSKGEVIYGNKIKHSLARPKPFHVESDSKSILNACIELFLNMVDVSGGNLIAGAGLGVQRSTFLFWDKKTLEPITPALSWQDCRAQIIADEFSHHGSRIWDITGAPLSGFFGGPKFLYMVRNYRYLAKKIKSNELFFGPLSAFLTHSLTGKAVVDESIACRSQLFNLKTLSWSKVLLDLFEVPPSALPRLVTTDYDFGNILNTTIPLKFVMGDQQASLVGQTGFKTNIVASNFGTSGSIQCNTGENVYIVSGLISSVLFSNKVTRLNMVEGTINSCNSIFSHLEKILNIDHKNMDWEKRCIKHSTEGIFLPGFSGLASPYWRGGFDDIYWELKKNNANSIIRAGMESIGFLVYDIINTIQPILKSNPTKLYASGGGARVPLLQFISNLLKIPVENSSMKDSTAFGLYKLLNPNYNYPNIKSNQIFFPSKMNMNKKIKQWHAAISSIKKC